MIALALPGIALNIEHVGPTAVLNLAAKPTIDIHLIVSRHGDNMSQAYVDSSSINRRYNYISHGAFSEKLNKIFDVYFRVIDEIVIDLSQHILA